MRSASLVVARRTRSAAGSSLVNAAVRAGGPHARRAAAAPASSCSSATIRATMSSRPVASAIASGEHGTERLVARRRDEQGAAAAVPVCGTPSSSEASCVRIACSSARSGADGSIPKRRHELLARLAVDLERLGLAARAVEREHLLAAQPLAQRVLGGQRLELAHERGVPPEQSSASIRSSIAARRSSRGVRRDAAANCSYARSASGGPRQSSSASRAGGRGCGVVARAGAPGLRRQALEAVEVEVLVAHPEDGSRAAGSRPRRPSRARA